MSYKLRNPLRQAIIKLMLLSLLSSTLAGLFPPPLVRTVLFPAVAELVEATSAPFAALAAPAAAPLAQVVNSSVLTITKSVVGSANLGPYNVTITGPGGYSNNTTVSVGSPRVLTSLASGIYTVTESSPGTGWTTSYSMTNGSTVGNSAVVNLFTSTPPATAPGQISGKVYRDFNSNGQFDQSSTFNEVGLSSVTVTAYDRNGVAQGATTTDASGNYNLTTTGNGPYRLEFSSLPTGYQPSTHGSSNGTSTQFVSAPANNINLGVNQPCDYCQSTPPIATVHFLYGDPLIAPISALPGLLHFPYDPPYSLTTDASVNDFGATWGIAYKRDQRLIFTSAVQRRFSGYGTLGTGGIYYFNRTTNQKVAWLNANTLPGVNTGADPHTGLPAVGAWDPALRDPASYDVIGKLSFGGLDLSDDDKTLWVMNLFQRTLLEIPLTSTGAPATPTTVVAHDASNLVTCPHGQFRPWATRFYNGKVYIGGVCSGENGGSKADLSAYVFTHDPAGPVGNFTQIYSQPLTYARPCTINFGGASDCSSWHQWEDTWPASFEPGGGGYYAQAQPMLTDLEIDVDGSLILGLSDRWGYQTGDHNYQPNAPDTTQYSGTTAGDILRACLVNGAFVSEGSAGCPQNQTDVYSASFKEFYQDSVYGAHPESAVGGLTMLPGRGEIASTKIDPDAVFAAGVTFLDNTTGAKERGDAVTTGTGNPSFNKAASIGDLELLCDPAPIEIGNRAWNDINNNGVQDAGEPGMNGLTVSLQGPTGAPVTTSTNGDGNYYFNNLSANTQYTLTLTPPNGYSLTQADASPLSGVTVTSNHAISDTRDSDAVLVAGKATIYYTTGTAGQNNHGLDFGFTQPATGKVDITNTAPGAIQVSKQVATTDGSNPVVNGNFTVNVNCDGATLLPSNSQTIAAGGTVTFSGIPASSSCTISEETSNLPAAPSGYAWLLHQVTPSQVTISAGQTRSVTVRNTLAAIPPASGVLTITKTLSGTGSGPFNLTVTGPNGYNNSTTVNPGTPRVLTGLTPGIYTVTETAPGPGWTTIYTATPGTGGNSQAVVTLQNTLTTTPFTASSNVALGRTATQSADYQPTTTAPLAVDGNTDGILANGSIAVANVAANSWWQVDLGAIYQITTINLWSRTDGFQGQASNVRVFVSDTPFASTDYNTTLTQSGVSNYQLGTAVAGSNSLTVNRSGRYVRVQHTNTDYLSLAEVQIMAQAISGLVFKDFNSDGQFSTGTSKDVGLGGVTVTAYDKNGNVVGSATTSATGSYAIPVSVAGPYRVEMSNLPAGYEPSFHGSGNGTSTQFVTAAGASVNFGVNHPADYSQNNPYLFVPQLWNGSNSGSNALSRFHYDLTGEQGVATDTQIGSVWGLAYARTSKTLYASTFLKRHTGIGPGGLGAIYALANANGATVGTPTIFASVPNVGTVAANATRGVNVTGDTANTDAGTFDQIGKVGLGDVDISDDESTLWTVNLNTRSLVEIPIVNPSNQTTYAIPLSTCGVITDATGSAIRINVAGTAFTDSGSPARTWLADTAFTGGALWQTGNTITNLNNPGDGTGSSGQTLYQGMRYGSAFAYTFPLPDGAYTVRLHFADVAGAVNRAFSVKANGTTMLTGVNPYGLAGNQVNRAVVQSFTTNVSGGKLVLDFVDDPGGDGNAIVSGIEVIAQAGNLPTGEFRPFATKYYRGKVYVGGVCNAEYSRDRDDLNATVYQFDPVTTAFTAVLNLPLNYTKGRPQWFCDNQTIAERWNPWITEYLDSAKVNCDEGTRIYPSPILSDLEFDVDGSLILGFMDRFGHQTGWANRFPDGNMTENGVAGGDVLRAGYVNGSYQLENNGQVNSSLFGTLTGTAGNNQGPGGGEFYNFDYARSFADHQETSLGGLALLPGSQKLVMSAMDPDGVWVGGVTWGSNTNGALLNWLVLQDNVSGGLRKGGSQGDVEILSDPAPIEIGNRVWNDINGNGVQDPGEPGFNGITVSRQSPTNTVTTVTSGDGNYYFAVSPNTLYTLTVTPPSGYSVTQLNAQALAGAAVTSNHPISDTRDSDAVLMAGKATLFYTTGSAGQNNHGLDFGFTQPVSGRVGITNTAPTTPSYTLSKQLLTPDPVRVGDDITFTIRITNTGSVLIDVLPLRDLYNTSDILFDHASVPPDDSTNDGQLDWSDLTVSLGQDLASGQSFALTTVFVARKDTTLLPGGATNNVARVLLTPTQTVTTPVRIEAPTAVALTSQSASYSLEQGVMLAWSTASDAELAGFHLLRRELDGAGWVQINADLIPAQQPGQAIGASYSFIDSGAQFGHTYLYVVEMVDASGSASRHELGLVVAGSRVLLPLVAR